MGCICITARIFALLVGIKSSRPLNNSPKGGRHQFGIRRLKQIHSLLMTAEISTLTADARKSEKCLEQHSPLPCCTAALGHRQERRAIAVTKLWRF